MHLRLPLGGANDLLLPPPLNFVLDTPRIRRVMGAYKPAKFTPATLRAFRGRRASCWERVNSSRGGLQMHRSDDRLLGAGPQTTTASRSRSTIHAFATSGPGRSLVAALALALVMAGGDLLDRLHVAPPVPERAAAQAQEGQWDGPYSILPPELSILGAHVTVLPSGKIHYWNTNYVDGAYARSQIWDPVLDVHTRIDAPQNRADENNVFCTGHAFLPDGRLLVTGGHLNWWNAAFGDWGAFRGLPYTNIFEPFDGALGTWSSAALPDMNAGRWYPTNTSLATGDVLVVSGTTEAELTEWNVVPQVWQVATGAWRTLASQLQVYYPWMFVDPKLGREGWVFEAGPNPETWWLNTTGSGEWIPGPLRDNPLAYPGVREYGSAVMYEDGPDRRDRRERQHVRAHEHG